MRRRTFLASVAASALARRADAVIAAPASTKKVAALVTAYFRYSHADNIVTRFMEGYSIAGKSGFEGISPSSISPSGWVFK